MHKTIELCNLLTTVIRNASVYMCRTCVYINIHSNFAAHTINYHQNYLLFGKRLGTQNSGVPLITLAAVSKLTLRSSRSILLNVCMLLVVY